MASSEEFVERLQDVLVFLQDHGFDKALDAVYEQLHKQQMARAASSSIPEEGEDRGATSPLSAPEYDEEYEEEPGDVVDEGRSRSADPVLSSRDVFNADNPPGPVIDPEAWITGEAATLSRRMSGSRRHYEELQVDEYDGPDDPGYSRLAVPPYMELVLQRLEEGGGRERGNAAADADGGGSEAGGPPTGASPVSGSQHSSHGHSTHAPDALQLRHGSPASLSSSASLASPSVSHVGLTPAAAAAPAAAGDDDAAWDAGPTDIVFADPVSISQVPRGSEACGGSASAGGAPRSLSRVESLSNSFIDDLESFDEGTGPLASEVGSQAGEAAAGGTRTATEGLVELDFGMALAAAAAAADSGGGLTGGLGGASEVCDGVSGCLDFAPDGIFDLGLRAPSHTSSLDVKRGSMACSVGSLTSSRAGPGSEAGSERGGTGGRRLSLSARPHPCVAEATEEAGAEVPAPAADGTPSGGAGSGGGGGGFSFPVTPPMDEEEHQHEQRADRVFGGWVGSQPRVSADQACTSEDAGAEAGGGELRKGSRAGAAGGVLPGSSLSSPGASGGFWAVAGGSGGKAAGGPSQAPPQQQQHEQHQADCSPSSGWTGSPQHKGGKGGDTAAQRRGKQSTSAGSASATSSSRTRLECGSGNSDAFHTPLGSSHAGDVPAPASDPGPLSLFHSAGGAGDADALPQQSVGRGSVTPAPSSMIERASSGPQPTYNVDDSGNVVYEYNLAFVEAKYEMFDLRVVHRRRRTGFEDTKEFPICKNDLIAGRYQVLDFLGAAAFSQAVQAMDIATGGLVCLKIIKNNKDYFDQSLDEIKLLRYVNAADAADDAGIVRLYDFFYYKEHLILVCELLRANLYEFQRYQREHGDEPYFTLPRIQRIASQVLRSLAFLHGLGLIHSDLKPENILIKSYSRCEVKVIDLGSSCFTSDHLSSYVQSRSYRAPEVILGLPYDQKVDVWSLGAILAELATGYVLFQNDSLATLLARVEGILGPVPAWMVDAGRYSHRYYTAARQLYERSRATGRYELLLPKHTSLRYRVPSADDGFLDFIAFLLTIDPQQRPSAERALQHPWLQYPYPPGEPMQD